LFEKFGYLICCLRKLIPDLLFEKFGSLICCLRRLDLWYVVWEVWISGLLLVEVGNIWSVLWEVWISDPLFEKFGSLICSLRSWKILSVLWESWISDLFFEKVGCLICCLRSLALWCCCLRILFLWFDIGEVLKTFKQLYNVCGEWLDWILYWGIVVTHLIQ